ncbi:MAG: PQQ-binding-like beta-propeller repeat protein [Acidobacteria bacterium]|nr:PQQ-binding-like beta-propeller repeat protein [Acidobacteriota bacterium]MDA1233340.1 PQQ-binding-like beta-propeller repeat protein [Acidobacteriota bacterium]
MRSPRFIQLLALLAFAAAPSFAEDWPMWGGKPERNMVSTEKGIPRTWDIGANENVKWSAEIGSQSYGNPVVAGGKVFVGTNNQLERNPKITGDQGVMMVFDEKTGEFLWQMTHAKLESGRVNDWPEQGVCSSPAVADGIVYYLSSRAELMALDVEGFRDGENDGPFTEEEFTSEFDGDVIWKLDLFNDLGVFPHNMAATSPLIVGDLIFVNTSNGVDESHSNIPSPRSPSFLAVNRKTGEILWEDASPGENILHGQWSSPGYGTIGGVEQAIFAGGDGWLRSFEPQTGKILWQFDVNPKDSEWKQGRGDRNNIIATPVVFDNKVFIAVGQDPEHGEGVGHLYAVDGTKRGDITESGLAWRHPFRRTISTVAISDGVVYAANFSGFLHALDLKTGELLWEHDLLAAVWGSPYIVDGKVLIGDEDGDIAVLQAGKTHELLSEVNMGNSVYSTPVVANGVLYIMTRSRLYAIAQK